MPSYDQMEDVDGGTSISAWQRQTGYASQRDDIGDAANPGSGYGNDRMSSESDLQPVTPTASGLMSTKTDAYTRNESTQKRESGLTSSTNQNQKPQRVTQKASLNTYELSTAASSYYFGPIKSIKAGTVFNSREEARQAGIHRATVKGIVGSRDVGCPSICVNGGYEDNLDTGYTIIYSGDGGKALTQKQLASGDQGEDQTWSPMNRALYASYKDDRAIRVLRGHKSRGACAPVDGYRYDGLYQILRCWISRSISFGHHKIINFALQRLANQDPISKDGKVYPEPEFIRTDLSGSWIDMPKHFYLIRQRGQLVEPAMIHFNDEFGKSTPAEIARERAPNHSYAKGSGMKHASGNGAVGPQRTAKSASVSEPPYTVPTNRAELRDEFGNIMAPAKIETSVASTPIIENVDFHKQVNQDVFKELFPDAEIKHPKRGYMRWRQRCYADNRVHQDLVEVERLDELEKQSRGK